MSDGSVARPPHPVHALTTYELRDYRKRLEQALADPVIGSAPVAAQLRESLARVLEEEQSRARIHKARGVTHYR
jgi:hypothetical protein